MSFKETAIAKLNEMKSDAHGVVKSTIADCITTLKWIPDDTDAQLSQFKKAQSEGRLLTLPCKIGDPVFVVGSKTRAGSMEAWVNSGRFRITDLPKVGTTIFLTREEAHLHQRLRQLGFVVKNGRLYAIQDNGGNVVKRPKER